MPRESTRDTPCATQIYDGAANLWRMVVVASVAVRWIDLGTKLVLRHVVRVLGAEQEGHSGHTNNNQDENGSENGGEGTTQAKSHRGKGAEEGVNAGGAASRTGGGGAKARAATAEVDLDEVRWAECTGREKQRKPSKSNARKLAGDCHALVDTPGWNKPVHRHRTDGRHSSGWREAPSAKLRHPRSLRHVSCFSPRDPACLSF